MGKGWKMRKRKDFSIAMERSGPYGGMICRILYKGQYVYAFGTQPDGLRFKRRRYDKSLLKNAETTICYLMAGLYLRANEIMDAIDAQSD